MNPTRHLILTAVFAALSACGVDGNGAIGIDGVGAASSESVNIGPAVKAPPADARVVEATELLDNAKCIDADQLDRARALSMQVLATDASNALAHVNLARYSLVSGAHCSALVDDAQLTEAENQLRVALVIDPRQTDALVFLGRVLALRHKDDAAIVVLQRAEALGSKNALMQVHFALAYIGMRDWTRAEDRLRKVPACRPDASLSSVCGSQLATQARLALYTGKRDYMALGRAYLHAIEAFPDSAFMHGNYAVYLIQVGRPDASVVEVTKAQRIRQYDELMDTMALALYEQWALHLHDNPGAAQKSWDRAELYERNPKMVVAAAGCGVGDSPGLQALVAAFSSKGLTLATQDSAGNTALMFAASCGGPQDVTWLLAHGAPIDQRDADGWTSLGLASSDAREAIVDTLLTANANVDIANNEGETPLISAAIQDSVPIGKRLVDAKADLDAVDKAGSTALMESARRGNEQFARMLLDGGAKTVVRVKGARVDAATIADTAGHSELAALIRAHRR